MVGDELLAKYSPELMQQFTKDFKEILRVVYGLDLFYAKSKDEVKPYFTKLKKVLVLFNKKYPGIRLEATKTIDRIQLHVVIPEQSVRDFFANSGSKIKGLTAVGLAGFNEVQVADSEKFSRLIDALRDTLYLSYSHPEKGTNTLAAIFNKKLQMVEIVASPKELKNTTSVDFNIVAYYALAKEVGRSITITEKLVTLGFYNLLAEPERVEWLSEHRFKNLE